MAKSTSLTQKTPAELSEMLVTLREELRGHRFASAGSRPKDTSARGNTRRQVARVMTALGAQKNTRMETSDLKKGNVS